MTKSIEITVPVLNEASTLREQIEKLRRFIARDALLQHAAIVITDNGSSDGTREIALDLEASYSRVRYVRLEERGVGRALKASWGHSNADIVGYMDLDLATDLVYLRPAIDKLVNDEADIVTGSRLANGACVKGRSALRNFTSRSFNAIVKLMFRTSFSDGMCGFKFLRRELVPRLTSAGAVSDGWFFATELLVVGEFLGYRIYDLAVLWTDDPNSKVKIGKLSIEYLRAMFHLRRRLRKDVETQDAS